MRGSCFIADGSAYMHDIDINIFTYGLPWWFSGKESTCNIGDAGDMGSVPGVGKIPWRRRCIPLQYSCLESPKDRGDSLTSVHGITKRHD